MVDDPRARILAALHEAYRGITGPDMKVRHDQAADAVLEVARDATREVSEELARMKLADADRAARELEGWLPGRWWRVIEADGSLWCETSSESEARGALDTSPTPGLLERCWVQKKFCWRAADGDGARPSPDAISTSVPAPASEDARQKDPEAHSGSQGTDGSEATR